jgi:trans-AT polyketide synthase/acyltransferase/oxidoreductase domain-containing protein
MNLLCPLDDPELEQGTVELYLRHDVRFVEAAGYPRLTASLLRLRYSGAHLDSTGRPIVPRQIVAKVSRPEVARAFCAPAPAALVAEVLRRGWLTPAEAEIAARVPVSENLCVESDSGGHTDGGVALALLPAMVRLRDEVAAAHPGMGRVRVGAAGGLGAPEAIAAAFVLGAEFVVTGSVNQCTPQAGISDLAKNLLAAVDVQDTGYAPAGDMFELGARAQVVRKGTLFASRANKLYQIYRSYDGLDALPERLRRTLEDTYFRRSIAEVWQETCDYHQRTGGAAELDRAQRDPRHRMALVFHWYFAHSVRTALAGTPEERVNFQIQCGPAMGAFNRLVAGTELADWRARDVVTIAELLMRGAADRLGISP